MASSKYGNKIHIYTLADFQLRFCIYLGKNELDIINSRFDKKSKFLMILSGDLLIKMFNLKHSVDDYICECDEHDDDSIVLKGKTANSSFFGGILNKLSTVLYFYINFRKYSRRG
jgi:hypothetical protein